MDQLLLSPQQKNFGLIYNLVFFLCWFPSLLVGQSADLRPAWDRDFGGNIWEDLHAVEETTDGGYILAGFSSSSANGDVTEPTRGAGDIWVIKTDDQGQMQWNRRYGGTEMEQAWAVKQTADGGYLIGGWSDSNISGEKSDNSRGYLDYWVVRTDAAGNYLWDQTYGGDSTDFLYDLELTDDGGFVIGGMSHSGSSGEKSQANRGDLDLWVVKADANGLVEWERSYGGNGEDRLNEIVIDTDGHFLLGGGTRSDIGNEVAYPNYGVKDFWLLKVDRTNGDTLWTRRYGGDDEDEIIDLSLTSDNNILLGGASRSNIGFDKSEPNQGVTDMWIVKIDRLGNVLWDRTFGGAALDNCYAVKENSIGFYLVGGFSGSDAGIHKTEDSRGGLDYWLVYLDADGNKQWDKTLGGDRDDVLENLFQTSDGGYLLAGHSQSGPSGDKTSDNKGLNDYWIIKTDCSLVLDLPDTMACPDQAFILDAYDPQCLACDWQWNDGNTDSVRMIVPTDDIVYSVTLTDGVGCARNDDIRLQMLRPPSVDLGGDQTLCPGDSTILDAQNSGLSFHWSTGEMTQTLSVDSSGSFAVTVTDNNGCYTSDSLQVQLVNAPFVALGNDTTICAGESLLLDAGFLAGASYRWSISGDRQTLEVRDPGTYAVTVTDLNGCAATDSISVDQYSAPIITNLTTTCNEANSLYVIRFDITGGDSATYQVNGLNGTINGRTFVSDSIPKDSPYNFSVTDGRNCLPFTVSGAYDCDCETSAGVLSNQTYRICGNDSILIEVEVPATMDQNDRVIFVLHDGDEQNLGTILLENESGIFSYDPALVVHGQTYFVTQITGNNEGNSVDFNDGCLAISTGVPIVFYPKPVAVIQPLGPARITCDNGRVVLDGSVSQPVGNLLFDWATENGGNIIGNENGPQVEVDAAADYVLTVASQSSGCIDTAMFNVESDEGVPLIDIGRVPAFTCRDTLLRLDATGSSSGSAFSYQWQGPGIVAGANSLQLLVNSPGDYTLTIFNSENACSATEIVPIPVDTLRPFLQTGEEFHLDCVTEQARLQVDLVTQGEADFRWSTVDGNFVGSADTLYPMVDGPGLYRLEVEDLKNGCSTVIEVRVGFDPNTPQGATIRLRSPDCFGENSGEILIETIDGGTSPLLVSFNEGLFGSQRLFGNLTAGAYPLRIQDANGCEWDTLVQLQDPPLFILDLGPSVEIELGDSTLLAPFVNQHLRDFSWSPAVFLQQPDSLLTYASPSQTTNFILSATDTFGCTLRESILVKVNKERRVYIPNIFSPNFDGHNDNFTVFGGRGVERVRSLEVFDRWGAMVFAARDFLPNIPSMGWDGRYQGAQINPGVYIYTAVVVFSDGTEIRYQGDVTVLK